MLRPFLKWAGSKTRIIGALRENLPRTGTRFIEPFVGSGAAFLNLEFESYLLCDSNPDLINLYRALNTGRGFIAECRALFTRANNSRAAFEALRVEFNRLSHDTARAALFVYLNRHCYNGLCRYNSKGLFNVPFGRYTSPYFPEQEMATFAAKLKSASLKLQDFRETFRDVHRGDVVYCDPPYVPLSRTASFTDYSAGGFSHEDQKDLADVALQAASRGATVLISNHDTPETEQLYSRATKRVGLLVSRTISCNGADRSKAKEILALFAARAS